MCPCVVGDSVELGAMCACVWREGGGGRSVAFCCGVVESPVDTSEGEVSPERYSRGGAEQKD